MEWVRSLCSHVGRGLASVYTVGSTGKAYGPCAWALLCARTHGLGVCVSTCLFKACRFARILSICAGGLVHVWKLHPYAKEPSYLLFSYKVYGRFELCITSSRNTNGDGDSVSYTHITIHVCPPSTHNHTIYRLFSWFRIFSPNRSFAMRPIILWVSGIFQCFVLLGWGFCLVDSTLLFDT